MSNKVHGTVLVVDDEEGIRWFLEEALETDGHEIAQAEHGEAALALMRSRSFDLVITDLKMPKMDGMSLLSEVRRLYPETAVLVLTAHGSVDNAVEAMKRGAFDYLQKPISSPEALRLHVCRALEHQRLLVHRTVHASDAPALSYGAPAMARIEVTLAKVAPTEATVLLLGESGTGKEVAARWIHAHSPRSEAPFVAVNCAALTETLLESELFGHEKGAFTGADQRRRGKIELAAGGTFFLDEVGELRAELQAKLLRVLEARTFERLGGSQVLTAQVRWVAATNRDLRQMVSEGRFREDLYHRLAVFPITLPALRERPEDVVPLARALLLRIAAEMGRPGLSLSADAEAQVKAQAWPGNIRALRNALERAVILCEGDVVQPQDLWLEPAERAPLDPTPEASTSPGPRTLVELEKEAIAQTLARCDGNRQRTAEQLGIGLRTLYEKIKKYGLS